MPPERPIFIVGCPRSGTTLLSTMLHSHPRIAIAPETRFLLRNYRNRESFGDLQIEANRRKLAREITRPYRAMFRDLGIDRRRTMRRIVSGPPTLGSAFGAVWQEFAEARGKPRWGEKRPAYWWGSSIVLRLFPDAQFIHVTRDPRSCVASLLAAPWWRNGFEHAVATWVLADHHMRQFRRRQPGDVYHSLRYEDLVTDPRATLQSLCVFLGEDFDDAMLDHTSAAADIVPERTSWHERTRGPLDPARAESWRSTLSAHQVGLIELVTRRRMKTHGYRPSGLGARPSAAELAAYYNRVARFEARILRARRRDRGLQHRETQPVAAVTAAGACPDDVVTATDWYGKVVSGDVGNR